MDPNFMSTQNVPHNLQTLFKISTFLDKNPSLFRLNNSPKIDKSASETKNLTL
jgi:hypothetical protein